MIKTFKLNQDRNLKITQTDDMTQREEKDDQAINFKKSKIENKIIDNGHLTNYTGNFNEHVEVKDFKININNLDHKQQS